MRSTRCTRQTDALLLGFLERVGGGKGCVVLTGAGCSTESGIPDYRGPHGRYRREDFVPLTFQQFMRNDYEKKRYWARSMMGYSTMSGASCNPTHMGLYALCKAGIVSRVITQNVDGLHHLAAHGGVGDASEGGYFKYTASDAPLSEVHGNIHQVVCLECGEVMPRVILQRVLREINGPLYEEYIMDTSRMRPDGDYNAPSELVHSMKLIGCPKCGGYLKPHVVLFGENVPLPRVRESIGALHEASCLVCLGTSLQVYSAYRYVLAAKEANIPIAIINAGTTRADGMEDLKIDTTSTATVISELVRQLLGKDALPKVEI